MNFIILDLDPCLSSSYLNLSIFQFKVMMVRAENIGGFLLVFLVQGSGWKILSIRRNLDISLLCWKDNVGNK